MRILTLCSLAALMSCTSRSPEGPTPPNHAALPVSEPAKALVDQLRKKFVVHTPDPLDPLSRRRLPTPFLPAAEIDSYQDPNDGEHVSPHLSAAAASRATRQASVLLPKAASGTIVLSRKDASEHDLTVRLRATTAAAAELAGDLVVYRSAHASGADLLIRGTAVGPEDYFYFPNEPRNKTLEYEVTLGQHIAGARLLSNTLEFLDKSGTPLWRMNPPKAVDSRAVASTAQISLPDCKFDTSPNPPWGRPTTSPGANVCTVRITLPATGISYPALLDPQWATGGYVTPRYCHTATSINSRVLLCEVLVVAGLGNTDTTGMKRAELYTPSTSGAGSFSPVPAELSTARYGHVSGSLPDGRVVIVGGRDPTNGANGAFVATAQIYTYDANLGSWSPERTYGGEGQGRLWMLSAVLDDGAMVVGGGFSYTPQRYSFFNETDLLDPRGEWKTIGFMWPSRWGATLTPVWAGPGERVAFLAAGGNSGYDVVGATALLTLVTVQGGCNIDADCQSGYCRYPDGGTGGACWPQ
jgi:hypothetical protein